MPEGPEIYLAADFINSVSKGRIFSEIRKSTVSKHSEISWPVGNEFTISAQSRGKELLMKLTPNGNYSKNISCRSILFQFGMTGKFVFLPVDEMPKHSHLMFFTSDKLNALIFEDYRRFGKWTESEGFSEGRGPDPVWEFDEFKKNVLENFETESLFNRSIL